jgi:Asp-tRNA(Asn)/Glu-tRNA(Gln) amidotransferase A subunit family amidase
MPCGFQLVAAPYDEALLFALGEAFQSRTAHHRKHPAID